MKNLISRLLLISLISGCGYRWQPEVSHAEKPTISIPFVEGDEDGRFTGEIVRKMAASGLYRIVSVGGEYQLKVNVSSNGDESIGFRTDAQKVDGKLRRSILAVEGRKTMVIEVSVNSGEKVIYGPYTISSDAEYDYVDGDSYQDLTFINPDGKEVTVLPFSLGQLVSIESAQEASTNPLYSRLAQKIVDALARHGT